MSKKSASSRPNFLRKGGCSRYVTWWYCFSCIHTDQLGSHLQLLWDFIGNIYWPSLPSSVFTQTDSLGVDWRCMVLAQQFIGSAIGCSSIGRIYWCMVLDWGKYCLLIFVMLLLVHGVGLRKVLISYCSAAFLTMLFSAHHFNSLLFVHSIHNWQADIQLLRVVGLYWNTWLMWWFVLWDPLTLFCLCMSLKQLVY